MYIKQHRILSFIIFVILAFVLFKLGQTFLNNNQNVNNPEILESTSGLVDMSLVSEIPLVSNSKYGNATGVYPRFTHVDPSFNDKIRNSIIIAQSEFENNSKENWQARINTASKEEDIAEFPDLDHFTFNTKVEYIQVNRKFISILITISGYSGGAHGYESMYSYNYDVQNNKEITLSDIFSNDENYLRLVSDYSRKNLLDQFKNKTERADFDNDEDYNNVIQNITDMIIPGTNPTIENFSIFTIEPGFINIYFSQYQVAPYVYGSQIVKMPLESNVLTN